MAKEMVSERDNIRKKEYFEASNDTDTELELFKKQHNLKTDTDAYEFLKKRLYEKLGVIQ